MRVSDLPLVREYRDSFQRTFRDEKCPRLKSRRHYFLGTAGASAAGQFASATFNTSLLLILMQGADAVEQAGYLATISIINSVLGGCQLISPAVFEPLRRRKWLILLLMITASFITMICYPALALLPLALKTRMRLYITLTGVATACTAIYSPSWSVLTVHSLPDSVRSDYFSISTIFSILLNAVLSFTLGLGMDWFKGNGTVLAGICIFRAAAVICVAWEYWNYWKMEEPEYRRDREKIRLRDVVTAPFASRTYLLICAIHVSTGIACAFSDTFFSAYLLDTAKISYTYFGVSNVIRVPFSLIFLPLWNRMIHKKGWLRAFSLSLVFYASVYFLNGLVTEQSKWIYLVLCGYCNMISGGYNMGSSNLPYMHLPPKLQSSCITFYNLLYLVGTAGSVWVAKRVYAAVAGVNLHLFGLTIEPRAWFEFISCGALLLVQILIRMVIRRTESSSQVGSSMRL